MRPKADCMSCGEEFSFYPTERRGKFCSQACKNEWMWLNVTKPNIVAGTASPFSIASYRRFLTERDGYKCSSCGIHDWQGKPLQLDIDHRDGDRKNNRGENLRYLCPNCHNQEPTSFKNKRFARQPTN